VFDCLGTLFSICSSPVLSELLDGQRELDYYVRIEPKVLIGRNCQIIDR
jgi:hypothetical protein